MEKQNQQSEWHYQWSRYRQSGKFLFEDWIYPTRLEDFKNKTVLDCGCGSGDHLKLVAMYAERCVGIDLNSAEIARENLKGYRNVEIIEGDIATLKLDEKFDIVYSIGVLHHTINPSRAFNNIKKFVKKNGKLIIWVYSYEGNFLTRTFLEYLKRIFFLRISKKNLERISKVITALMYIPIYSIYLLPLKFLPYYFYFQNWRRLNFQRNFLNVFDKLNAPTTHFIKREVIESWFNGNEFIDVYIDHYKGVSWRASGIKI
ncbi:MAG: hypothetical protein DRP08_02535 [Candidatus Aenigmatarchaeota archaeon]|nr:MAG: hypothetical protein DRP08_02535 [Candidatus Aenigmarchaeota archaeon]